MAAEQAASWARPRRGSEDAVNNSVAVVTLRSTDVT